MEHYATITPFHSSSTSPNTTSSTPAVAASGRSYVLERKGNTSRAVWLKTCWKYSEEIHSSLQLNYTQSLPPPHSASASAQHRNRQQDHHYLNYNHDVALLESTIYSALSSHYLLLKDSKLIRSWSDHLWAYLRCHYEHTLMAITHQLNHKKAENSLLYPGVTKSILKAEEEYLIKTKVLSTAMMRNSEDLHEVIASPSHYHTSVVTVHLLELQQSVVLGYEAMKSHIQHSIVPYAISCLTAAEGNLSQLFQHTFSASSSSFSHSFSSLHRTAQLSTTTSSASASSTQSKSTILRVYTHYLLWLFYSCPDESHSSSPPPLPALVSYEQLSLVIEAYLLELIVLKRYHLVALYTSYLVKSKRIALYSRMMILLSPEGKCGLDGSTAEDILRLGYQYFGREEMNEITHEVINHSRHLLPLVTGGGAGVTEELMPMTPFSLAGSGSTLPGFDTSVIFTPMTKASTRRGEEASTLRSAQSYRTTHGPSYPTRSQWMLPPDSPEFAATPMTMASARFTTGGGVGGAVASASGSGEGRTRMEALKWLCLRKEESFIALVESNNFMKSLVLEVKNPLRYQQIHEILATIITTSHFKEVFQEYQVLEEKVLMTVPHHSSLGVGGEGEMTMSEEMMSPAPPSLALSEQLLIHNLESEFSFFLFWKKYDRVLTQFQQWSDELLHLRHQYVNNTTTTSSSSSLSGGTSGGVSALVVNKLTRCSEDLTRMICGVLDCEEEEDEEKAHDIETMLGRNQLTEELLTKLVKECILPYEVMWRKSVASSFLSLRVCLTEFYNQPSPSLSHGGADLISSETLQDLHEEILSLVKYFQTFEPMNQHLLTLFDFTFSSHFGSMSGGGYGSDLSGGPCGEAISLHGYPVEDFNLFFQRLEEIKEKFGHSRVTLEAHLKCRDYLSEIKDSKEVSVSLVLPPNPTPQMMAMVSFQLLDWFMKVLVCVDSWSLTVAV
jgi:hypothetical protein